jgi:hypothetical protein
MKFADLIDIETKYLGGGYYHPDMLADGRIKDNRYAASGETMYDIDRKNGGTVNTGEAGKKFWALIDAANARKVWKWNYMGGALTPQLKPLVSEMIYPLYIGYCKKWLSADSLALVNGDVKLTFNFIYAVFNGPGWFKYFANAMNIYVDKQGIKDVAILMDKMIYERIQTKNSLIVQGAKTMTSILPKITGKLE